MKARLMLIESCATKLMLVKALKEHTGLGLIEAKHICDELHEMPYRPVEIELDWERASLLKKDLLEMNLKFHMDGDRGFERERKLLEIGIGEKEDYISFFDEFGDLFENQKEILKLALNKLSTDDLKEIFGKAKTKI